MIGGVRLYSAASLCRTPDSPLFALVSRSWATYPLSKAARVLSLFLRPLPRDPWKPTRTARLTGSESPGGRRRHSRSKAR